MDEQIFGLTTGSLQIPLIGVEVEASIMGRATRITCRQKFENRETHPLECIYKFPLPESSALCGFLVILDGRILKGAIEERDTALSAYKDSIAGHSGAYLLNEECPNIFTLYVGNLLPGKSVLIEISYVMKLECSGDESRFFLPTTISPRYIPEKLDCDKRSLRDRQLNPDYLFDVPYGLKIHISICGKGSIKKIQSPSHEVKILDHDDRKEVTFIQETAKMDRDFILTVSFREKQRSQAFACCHGNNAFMQIDFNPEYKKPPEILHQRRGREIIFFLDCSGSMAGSSIEQAKQAMGIMLRGLENGMTFNVYRFGSDFDKLFPTPAEYNKKSLETALRFLARTDADKGGTEIMMPLEDAYQEKMQIPERDFILITDGEVENENEIVQLASKHKENTRFHMLGIGYGPNEYFIKQVARATRAISEMVAPGERIELKALKMFQKIIQGDEGTVRVSMSNAIRIEPKPPLPFYGDVITLLAKINDPGLIPENIYVSPSSNTKSMIWDISLLHNGQSSNEWAIPVQKIDGDKIPIPLLWARERIRRIEGYLDKCRFEGDHEKVKAITKILVKISQEYGIISSATSFIAVEERSDKNGQDGQMAVCPVPVILTKDWGAISDVALDCLRSPFNAIGRGQLLIHSIEEEIELSVRTMNCLRNAKIFTFGDLVQKTEKDLMSLNSFGKKSLKELMDALSDMGLSLGMRSPSSRSKISSSKDNGVKKMKKEDIMLILLTHQRSEGGFEADPQFLRLINMPVDRLTFLANGMETKQKKDKAILIITAIALYYLRIKFQDKKDYWDRIVRKSEEWLKQQIDLNRPSVEGKPLDKWAMEFIENGIE